MKIITVEFVSRALYCIGAFICNYGFNYLNQALVLEYYSGLILHYYQYVEYNIHVSVVYSLLVTSETNYAKTEGIFQNIAQSMPSFLPYPSWNLEQRPEFCFSNSWVQGKEESFCFDVKQYVSQQSETFELGVQNQPNLFVNYACQNEARSWNCLFYNSLCYFYCVQLPSMNLNLIINFNNFCYVFVFASMQLWAFIVPGVLKQQTIGLTYVLNNALFLIALLQLNNHYFLLSGLTLAQEFRLEPVDSELQTFKH